MNKRWMMAALAAVVAGGLAGAPEAAAQDDPGMSVGAFFERRVDNNVTGSDRTFDYYGARFKLRDERWYEVYVDIGVVNADWWGYETEMSGLFGLGGTIWGWRAEDLALEMDIGLHLAAYAGSLGWEGGGVDTETYLRFIGQAVFRGSDYERVRPIIRAGIMGISSDGPTGDDKDSWNRMQPVLDVILEVTATDRLLVILEGSYSAGAGFGARLEYWF